MACRIIPEGSKEQDLSCSFSCCFFPDPFPVIQLEIRSSRRRIPENEVLRGIVLLQLSTISAWPYPCSPPC